MELTATYVFRNAIKLGYTVLESYLSTIDMVDRAIVCYDPTSDEQTLQLVEAMRVSPKYGHKTQVVPFVWPLKQAKGDGSVIGIATKFAVDQVTTSHVINIQSDEVYPVQLMEMVRDNWRDWVDAGYEAFKFKILHTEHNAQQFQGGEIWDGRKDTDMWRRGGLFNGQVGGAGYDHSFKMIKKCNATKLEHDAWSFVWEGFVCGNVGISETFPIVHLHDFHRDHLIDLRRNAADNLWTDQEKFGNYKYDADQIEQTREQWYNSPKWTNPRSPFEELLPDYVRPLIGKTTYVPRLELLR